MHQYFFLQPYQTVALGAPVARSRVPTPTMGCTGAAIEPAALVLTEARCLHLPDVQHLGVSPDMLPLCCFAEQAANRHAQPPLVMLDGVYWCARGKELWFWGYWWAGGKEPWIWV